MLPSFVANLIWGEEQDNKNSTPGDPSTDGVVDHTVTEEAGDWLVIDYTSAGENDSVTSESSWIVAPSPRFRSSSTTSSLHDHQSVENLLLEHPTMSVYRQCSLPTMAAVTVDDQEAKNKQLVPYDTSKMQVALYNQNNRQMIIHRRQARQELATQMGIPFEEEQKVPKSEPAASPGVPAKLTKKSLKKQNDNVIRVTRGKKSFKIHQCGVKAGRRRN